MEPLAEQSAVGRRVTTPQYKHWKNIAEGFDLCFITTTIERFVPLLAEPENARLLLSALDFYREKHGVLIHAYVLYPSRLKAPPGRIPGGIGTRNLLYPA
ncbi:MAG: hypothetical protein Q7T82_03365 [Armatimonadota bacterium]|nr:hypothetical protein [Armatimonadota bacterium]